MSLVSAWETVLLLVSWRTILTVLRSVTSNTSSSSSSTSATDSSLWELSSTGTPSFFPDNHNKSCYLRNVFVMKSFLVGTPQKRRLFCSLIIFSILSISLALSLFAVYYEEKNLHFLGTYLILKYTTIDLINFLVWVGI